ncbi:PIN domain-containing protein [Streptomyces sp. NPDC056738]|uniref:PIN domain-containing protein n=1 Tax=Streptomyces sp. NPDC056738 TaxID=3345933 RepID=UPI0036AA5392
MCITPRPGADRGNILQTLQKLHLEATNLRAAGQNTAYSRLLAYLEWVTGATRRLQTQVSAKDVDRLLQTRRYYALLEACGTMAGTAQQLLVNGLVDQELNDRGTDLEAAVTALKEHMTRWDGPAWLAVADPSFYLHSPQPLKDTDLHKTMGLPPDEEIHLIFPIAVVDELDRLKETGPTHPRWRAGHTLGRLDEVITSGTRGTLHPQAPGEGQAMRGRVTVEIVLDQPGHVRLPIADDEIIDRAATIQRIAGRDLRLLTCDTSQATRGRIAGLKVTKLPSNAGIGDEPPRNHGGDQPRALARARGGNNVARPRPPKPRPSGQTRRHDLRRMEAPTAVRSALPCGRDQGESRGEVAPLSPSADARRPTGMNARYSGFGGQPRSRKLRRGRGGPKVAADFVADSVWASFN